MKGLFLSILMFVVLTCNAQTTFTATEFTDDGKHVLKLYQPKHFIFDRISEDRVEFRVVQDDSILFDGFLTKMTLLRDEDGVSGRLTSSRLTVVAEDGFTERWFLFTKLINKLNGDTTFILTVIENNTTKRSYLGKIN